MKEREDELGDLFKAREEEKFREEYQRYIELEIRGGRKPLDYDEWLKREKLKKLTFGLYHILECLEVNILRNERKLYILRLYTVNKR